MPSQYSFANRQRGTSLKLKEGNTREISSGVENNVTRWKACVKERCVCVLVGSKESPQLCRSYRRFIAFQNLRSRLRINRGCMNLRDFQDNITARLPCGFRPGSLIEYAWCVFREWNSVKGGKNVRAAIQSISS